MKPASCNNCEGLAWGQDFSSVEGTGANGVLIVGEASGEAEASACLPFRPHAASGSLLERCFRRLGAPRQEWALTNILRCRPPANNLAGAPYEFRVINNCKSNLDAVVADYKPRVIVALGGIAARELLWRSGPRLGISAIRGFIMESPRYHIPVVPSLHPAFLRRGKMAWMGLLIRDLMLALEVSRNGVPLATPRNYITQPTVAQVEELLGRVLADPALLLAYDIETDYSHGEDEDEVTAHTNNITLVQFSTAPGEGIAIPWLPQFIPLIRLLLATPNPKLGQNVWKFDNPLLEANGCPVAGAIDDTMWAFHHIQPDLPRNLQSMASIYCPEFGPWKHTSGMDLAAYGCADVDILQRIWPRMRADMERQDVWRGYDCHVKQLWPILQGMSTRGIPMDSNAQEIFRTYLKEEIGKTDAQIQQLFPDELRNIYPPAGFTRDPEDTDGLVRKTFNAKHDELHLCNCLDASTGEIRGWTKKVATRCGDCKGFGRVKLKGVMGPVERWCRLEPFKASQQQLVRYMIHRGHKVPKVIGSDKDTTAKMFIERMSKSYKDPFYAHLLDFRGYQKMLGAYMWAIAEDGAVHPEFTFSPATGQLAAREPNVMTIPAPKGATVKDRLAVEFRKTIAAHPGYALVAFDYKSFHVSTFAFEAQDPDYFRLASAIEDPHSFLTACLLKLNTPEKMLAMDDEELKAYCAAIKVKHKAIRDGQAKPAILGYALGEGANKLYELNRWDPGTKAGFRNKREAAELIQTLRGIFPKGYAYQVAIRMLAHEQKFLYNKHGFIRWFWDVMHKDPVTGETVMGEQAEEAIAFNVQCDAHGHLKDAMLRLAARGLCERFGLCSVVHDELFFHCLLTRLEECLYEVQMEMEKPSEVLIDSIIAPGGLAVKVDASVGWHRGAMKSPAVFLDQLAKGEHAC